MPVARDNQKVLIHALVGFEKIGDQPNRRYPSLKIMPCLQAILIVIHPIDVVVCQFNSHLMA